ncbi:MAG: GDSL-type esterase/lipase family protein [Candidatus Aminicenantaceae bacterium]
MNRAKVLCALAFALVLIGVPGAAQEQSGSQHSPYWQQRASHFRLLPNDRGEIIFLGDSITEGCDWSEMFHNPLIKNRGISGDVTRGVLDRLDEVVESMPAKIFLMIGINDLALGLTEKQILANIKSIIREVRLKSPDTTMYLQSLLPVNPDFRVFPDHANKGAQIKNINLVLRRMAHDYGAEFVNLYPLFIGEGEKLDPEFTNDGLHLTGAGYAVWKEAVAPFLQ